MYYVLTIFFFNIFCISCPFHILILFDISSWIWYLSVEFQGASEFQNPTVLFIKRFGKVCFSYFLIAYIYLFWKRIRFEGREIYQNHSCYYWISNANQAKNDKESMIFLSKMRMWVWWRFSEGWSFGVALMMKLGSGYGEGGMLMGMRK